MVDWAHRNVLENQLDNAPIRWIVDDVNKFLQREIRRGRKYDGIIMDPPAYGRGPSGEMWKLEDALFPLVDKCEKLLSDDPLFFLINSYTTGLSSMVIEDILRLAIRTRHGGKVVSEELGLPCSKMDLILPCGSTGRWTPEE